MIYKMRVSNGQYVETREEIEEDLVNHFKQFMAEDRMDIRHNIVKITQHLPVVISQEHNDFLLKPVELQQVEASMQRMTLGKAPDRMDSPPFFSIFWGTS